MTAGERPTPRGGQLRYSARAASILACAAATGVVFFGLLALWGVAAAPFVRLESASFVIVAALAASSAIVVAGWRRLAARSSAKPAAGRGPSEPDVDPSSLPDQRR